MFRGTIRNMFGCGCYFVIQCYGSVDSGCSVGYTVHGLTKSACAGLVILLCVPSLGCVCIFVCRKLSPHLGL